MFIKTHIILMYFVVLISLGSSIFAEPDYCHKELCPPGTRHVACDPPNPFGPSCSDKKPKHIRMRHSMKRLLIHEHNRLRSLVASGKLPGFSSASRMPTLTWDDELQYIAGCNARLCRFQHDQCRNTELFQYAGQNLAMRSLQGRWHLVRIKKMLRDFVRSWFGEFAGATQGMIDSYPEDYNGPDIGHFTQIVSDRTWKLGCSMTRFTDQAIHYYLVCDYSFINIMNQPIYQKGKSCSRCQMKCSKKYPGLCNTGEKIESNP